jgi:ABC-type antimicrobial peptide transport system permease subunit
MTAVVAASMTPQQFTSGLLGVFAALATTLAVVGLYGVTALFVAQHRHEFGIRMALGARPADVLALVMSEGARAIVVGAALGMTGAFAARRVLSQLLFGVSASDVPTYAMGGALVCLVGLAACFVPACRAIAVDPIHVLREQ